MHLFGRRQIFTDVEEITEENVLSVLADAIPTHQKNRAEIQYLYDYYRGKQPILERVKVVRPEIENKVVENRAAQIVSFFSGYLHGEPIQYAGRGRIDEQVTDWINELNEYMYMLDKDAIDEQLIDWLLICGTSYRMILPDATTPVGEPPFQLHHLDPRDTFVIYWSGLGNKPVAGVHTVRMKDGTVVYSVYTPNHYYEIWSDGLYISQEAYPDPQLIKRSEWNLYVDVPIVEYPANQARLGSFEIVISLLDELNNLASNRMDAIESIVQSLLVFKGVDIDSEDFKALREEGGLVIPSDGDVKYISPDLNQGQSQTIVDYTYNAMLTICGMPNRSGYGSTSDTGTAVELRNGFTDAETRAKKLENNFRKSEKRFLRIAIELYNTFCNASLKLSDIDPIFTRRNYENIQTKSQVLTTMLNNDKIHPRLAFAHCGMFVDPELAYKQSMEYYEDRKKEEQAELDRIEAEATAAAQREAVEVEEPAKDDVA